MAVFFIKCAMRCETFTIYVQLRKYLIRATQKIYIKNVIFFLLSSDSKRLFTSIKIFDYRHVFTTYSKLIKQHVPYMNLLMSCVAKCERTSTS